MPVMDEMITTAPPPAERRCGSAVRMSSTACPAFSANVAVKSPGPELVMFPPTVPPALATRRSSPPSAAATSSTARPSAAVSVTSAAAVVTGTPCLASRPRSGPAPAHEPSAAARGRRHAGLGRSELAVVEAVPRKRLDQLGLLVGEMGEQRVGEDVHRLLEAGEIGGVAQMIHQRLVDVVQHLMDDLVLVGQPVDHRLQARLPGPQMREDRLVLEHVVPGHEPAVIGAVRAEGPVAAPHGHLVDLRPCAAGVDRALLHLADEIAHPGEFVAQMVMHLDEVRADEPAAAAVDRAGRRCWPGGAGGLVPHLNLREPLAGIRCRGQPETGCALGHSTLSAP